jgi:flagellar hook capping protein FlgD
MKSGRNLMVFTVMFLAAGYLTAADRTEVDDISRAVPLDVSQPAPRVQTSAAATDTLYLLGGPDRLDGQFQSDTVPGMPDNEGWLTPAEFEGSLWHIDTFNAELLDPGQPDNRAMWCGSYYPPCNNEPLNPGYGPSRDDWLVWSAPVGDPLLPTDVNVSAMLNYDHEPGYDYLRLDVYTDDQFQTIASWNGANKSGGVFAPETVDLDFAVDPMLYDDGEVRLRWRFTSDGAGDDHTCIWPTDGAAQIDNIAVSFDQGGGPIQMTFDDFELGNPVNWTATQAFDCGFGQVWPVLQDAGFCRTPNATPQLAFIDDGTACDAQPTHGTTWTYGPDGLVLDCETMGGLAGEFWSPVLELPDMVLYDGLDLEFDAYLHTADPDGFYGTAKVRFSEDGGFTWTGWYTPRGYNVFGASLPRYSRLRLDFGTFVPVTADRMQVSLGVRAYSYSYACQTLTPAPYYDNVAVRVYAHGGPQIKFPSVIGQVPGDEFKDYGTLDLQDLSANAVGQVPIGINAKFVRRYSVRDTEARLHWALDANPLFDAHRTLPANPIASYYSAFQSDGSYNYQFTLPDGFLFPGDRLHWYATVGDDVGGDTATAMMPADTTGFGVFAPLGSGEQETYPDILTLHALPTLRAAHADSVPSILVWDDTRSRSESLYLERSLLQLGYRRGIDYDIYRVSNDNYDGLGSRVTAAQMAGYTTMLYSSGRSSGDVLQHADTGLLNSWMSLGDRNLLVCGNNVVSGVNDYSGDFLSYLGVGIVDTNLRPLIDDQPQPGIAPTGAVTGFETPLLADGCSYEFFDALSVEAGAQVLHAFTGPSGTPGVYPYPAVVYNYTDSISTRAITVPVAFSLLGSPHDPVTGGLSARTAFLGEVLDHFTHGAGNAPAAVRVPGVFRVSNYPNPFNPQTTIAFDLPQRAVASLRIYDVSGRLVRELIAGDELAQGAHSVSWNGRNDRGQALAAGVYFYRLQAGEYLATRRMALIK